MLRGSCPTGLGTALSSGQCSSSVTNWTPGTPARVSQLRTKAEEEEEHQDTKGKAVCVAGGAQRFGSLPCCGLASWFPSSLEEGGGDHRRAEGLVGPQSLTCCSLEHLFPLAHVQKPFLARSRLPWPAEPLAFPPWALAGLSQKVRGGSGKGCCGFCEPGGLISVLPLLVSADWTVTWRGFPCAEREER